MRDVARLMEGYRAFMEGRYPTEAETYWRLAKEGQQPSIMVIACCDSRVDPAAIFSAGPGELFVVRNVANLVPPHEPHGNHHGTSAALEFAVTNLEVEHIVVLGHGQCGGIRAFLDGLHETQRGGGFIARWMSLLNAARGEALRVATQGQGEDLQRAVEHAAIRHSIDNLMTFPFVAERVSDGRLRLHGGYFAIMSGELLAMDPESGTFERVI